jgi:hypothetical protein
MISFSELETYSNEELRSMEQRLRREGETFLQQARRCSIVIVARGAAVSLREAECAKERALIREKHMMADAAKGTDWFGPMGCQCTACARERYWTERKPV